MIFSGESLRRASAIVLAIMASAGCAGTDSSSPPIPQVGGASPQPSATSAPSAQGACGTVAEAVRQHVNRSEIEKITVEGQCTTVVIATSLADADTATAKRMCDAASEIAYVGEVNSVRVLSAAGTELANGITGLKCLA